MPDLRKGQYKRLGRIAENNPERAERVAERMKTRASREERGKQVAGDSEDRKNIARDVSRMVERQDASPARREAVRRMTTGEGKTNQVKRADTPLAPTPEPWYSRDEPSTENEKAKVKADLRQKMLENKR